LVEEISAPTGSFSAGDRKREVIDVTSLLLKQFAMATEVSSVVA